MCRNSKSLVYCKTRVLKRYTHWLNAKKEPATSKVKQVLKALL